MAKAYFGNGAPFSRALDYHQRLGAMIRGGKQFIEAVKELGEYASRGHGRAKNSGLTVTKAHRATYLKLRGKQYEGTQGKREIARRLRTAPEPTARRMWVASLGTPWGDSVLITSSSRSCVAKATSKMLATGNYYREQATPVLGVLHG